MEKIFPKIYHSIPWNSSKNIGISYNEMMSLVDDDDWVCFIDGDAVHTTYFFGSRIEEVVQANPSYSLFTCYTNRIGSHYQILPGSDWRNDNQSYHRKLGEDLWNKNKTRVIDITDNTPISGVLTLIKKSCWQKVGGFKEEKMLAVDNDIHLKFKDAGFKIGLMTGIYLQHWYRGGDNNYKQHLF